MGIQSVLINVKRTYQVYLLLCFFVLVWTGQKKNITLSPTSNKLLILYIVLVFYLGITVYWNLLQKFAKDTERENKKILLY